jgi:hypothetical protein
MMMGLQKEHLRQDFLGQECRNRHYLLILHLHQIPPVGQRATVRHIFHLYRHLLLQKYLQVLKNHFPEY